MALTATIYNLSIQLADVDRAVYEDLELRVARQPSETPENMLTRVLAYCLEYEPGIAFTEGVAAGDEPAVLVRDLTGRITAWIEVGTPDADRLHRGSKLADRAAVYTHRDASRFVTQVADRKIHRAAQIPVYGFGREFIPAAVADLERRSKVSISVTERQLYFEVNGRSSSTPIEEHRLG